MPNILEDVFFPAGSVLRKAATSSTDVGADKAASETANARAAQNPSGIDMAAEAQKAAARSGVGPKIKDTPLVKPRTAPTATQGAGSTPVSPGTASRDHYKPRGN